MRPTVYYFEIPVNDLDRAITFYSAVFGCEFDRVDVDGNQMANFPSLEGGSGASGALAKGDSYIPGTQARISHKAVKNGVDKLRECNYHKASSNLI